MKKAISLILALVMVFGTLAVCAAAETADASAVVSEEETLLKEEIVPEEEVGFKTEIDEETYADNCFNDDAEVFAESEQPVHAASSVKLTFIDRIIYFFQKLFGSYKKIEDEKKLKIAAEDGGDGWSLRNNITVSSYILVSSGTKSLVIDGKGHKITRKNGEIDGAAENIFVVDHRNELTLKHMVLKTEKCQGVRVRTSGRLILDDCTVETFGDGIENYGFTQASGGTSMKTTGTHSAAIWNRITGVEGEIGEVVLGSCDISFILNDGTLTFKQDKSVVAQVSANAGSRVIMEKGHIKVYKYYVGEDLTKTGGTVDQFVLLGVNPGKTPIEKLIEKAIKEAKDGYREKKSNSDLNDPKKNAGSGNYTKYGAWYGNNGQPWCAMFVAWCANEAGLQWTKDSKKSMPAGGMFVSSYCPDITAYAKAQSKWASANSPKVGDLIFFDYEPNNSANHIGIIYQIEGTKISTIEGNNHDMVRTVTLSSTDTIMSYYRWG